MSAQHPTKDICLTREMLCGHSADIVRTYISRDICLNNVRTISFFGFQLSLDRQNAKRFSVTEHSLQKVKQKTIDCKFIFISNVGQGLSWESDCSLCSRLQLEWRRRRSRNPGWSDHKARPNALTRSADKYH